MNKSSHVWILCFVLFICQVYCSRRNTLVIVDDLSITSTHSKFFDLLTERGHQLDFHTPNDNEIRFQEFSDFRYDSLILFAPNSNDWNENHLSSSKILEFIDNAEGNVLIAGNSNVNYLLDDVASKCGVEFGDVGNTVVDHLNFEQSDFDGDHSLIVADRIVSKEIVENISPILYQGNGLVLQTSNRLVFPILSGSTTSYVSSGRESSDLHAAGTNLVLVAGLQARNNARVVISGSLDIFSNKFFDTTIQKHGTDKKFKSGNSQFADLVTKWNFGDKGIIRIKSITHHLLTETEPRPFYTIKDQIEYIAEIEEWNGVSWIGYNANDVQLEIQMLDPYIRTTLKPDGKGKFSVQFTAPDVYGVFTFKLDYHRVGYSSLSDRTLVTIRPFRHDQYERFIPSAFPYYTSAFSMMGGVAVFVAIYLFTRN